MTQLEMAIAAQENPWQDLLWFDWRYMPEVDMEWSGLEDDETMVEWFGVLLPLSHLTGDCSDIFEGCPECDDDDEGWVSASGEEPDPFAPIDWENLVWGIPIE